MSKEIDKEELIQRSYAQTWLANVGVVTPEYLNEVRYRLAVMYPSIKNIHIECDIRAYKLKLFIKLRWFRSLFINKSKLKNNILINLVELVPDYNVVIDWL